MSNEPEEMSMNEVLASIRQMLSDDTTDPVEQSEQLDTELEDIFVLTPEMRVTGLTPVSIHEKMKLALNKLAEQKPTVSKEEYAQLVQEDFQPLLKEWMLEQVPDMVEHAVQNQINKLLK